jgi:hypothetical protein
MNTNWITSSSLRREDVDDGGLLPGRVRLNGSSVKC